MFSKSTEYDENCTQFAKQHTKLHNLLKSAAYQENLTSIAFFHLFTFHIHTYPYSPSTYHSTVGPTNVYKKSEGQIMYYYVVFVLI